MKITQQELKQDGVLTTYDDGSEELLPYRIDSNGESYVEMFPNDPETFLEEHGRNSAP